MMAALGFIEQIGRRALHKTEQVFTIWSPNIGLG